MNTPQNTLTLRADKSLRTYLVKSVMLLSISALTAISASAQSAAADNAAVVLSPFSVNTSKDDGFVATSSLAGGRLASDLKDTPVAYSVITKEFLDAFNITDLTQAADWATNMTSNPGNNTDQGYGFSPAINITMRGSAPSESNYPERDFFPYNSNTDAYALDRFDFARGPNSVLFGAAQFGGTPSAMTKKALVTKTINQVVFQYGSWNKMRVTFDVNRPINAKAAIRLDAVVDYGNTFRQNEWRHKKGIFAAGTYNLTPKSSLKFDGEYMATSAKIFPTSLLDQVSAWDGKTTMTGPILPANSPTAAVLAQQGLSYGTSNANPSLSPLWVYDPTGFNTSNVLNFANFFRTKGAAGSSTAANSNYIGGNRIASGSVSYANQPMLYGYDVPNGRYDTDLSGSSYFSVPTQKVTNLWTSNKPTQSQLARDIALTYTHQVGDSLFFEVAGDTNKTTVEGNNAVNRGMNTEYIDINTTLPNGAANPEFRHPYTEFWTYKNLRWYELSALRAQAAYLKDISFGKIQFSVMGGANFQRQEKRSYLYLLPLQAIGPDARYWDAGQTSTALWNRLYLDQGGRDFYNTNLGAMTLQNQDGTSVTATPQWVVDATRKDNTASNLTKFKFVQTATNLNLFHGSLIMIGALRRDLTHLQTRNTLLPGDYPTGWNGSGVIFKPDAPANWSNLTYIPKSTAGVATGPAQPADTRPRLSVAATSSTASSSILAQPQYAGDKFRDDYNPPALDVASNTYSTGATYNVLKWLGIYGNASTTFNPNLLVQRLNTTLLPPTAAHGTDFGVRINTPDRRLSLSIGAYNSYQKNSPVSPPSGVVGNYNTIYSTAPVGNLNPGDGNTRGVGLLPTVVRDTQTQQSHGLEIEITANLTRSWRLLANGSYSRSWQSDSFPDTRAYILAQDTVARQILTDAGVLISSTNVASINPAVNTPTQINQTQVTNAVNAWNGIQTSVIPNMVLGRQKLAGSMEKIINIGTDYTFRTGTLKGFVVGIGAHYRGRNVVGYRGSDTIINPANTTATVDDPTVDAYTTVFAKPYITGDGRLGYSWKLHSGHTMSVNLNVQNLFNNTTPSYFLDVPGAQLSNTVLRPRNGDVTNIALETVPAGYALRTPINYTLGLTINL
jgi:hypothetical protein